jgi:hypothetical protein
VIGFAAASPGEHFPSAESHFAQRSSGVKLGYIALPAHYERECPGARAGTARRATCSPTGELRAWLRNWPISFFDVRLGKKCRPAMLDGSNVHAL